MFLRNIVYNYKMKVLNMIISCILLCACASSPEISTQRISGRPLIEKRGIINQLFDTSLYEKYKKSMWDLLIVKKGEGYFLEYLPECEYKLPPENLGKDKAGIIRPHINPGEYYVKGYLGKPLPIFGGNTPTINVIYIEKIK